MAQAANSDEAERCVREAELLLMGAHNWHEERKIEMVSKAVRLLCKSNQMSAAIMPSVPQWLAMRDRLRADIVRDAQRTYARGSTVGNGPASGTTPTGDSSSASGTSGSTGTSSPSSASGVSAARETSFLRTAWGKLEYVVYDMPGIGRYFSPEWKSTILMIYMIIFFLIVARLSYGAPLVSLLQYRHPTERYPVDCSSATYGSDRIAAAACRRNNSDPFMGESADRFETSYRRGGQRHMDDGFGDSAVANVQVYFPLLSWIVFFFIPIVLQQF